MRVLALPKRFFAAPERGRRWYSVIVWWELRRIPYNLFLCLPCLIIAAGVSFTGDYDLPETGGVLLFLFVLPSNVWYTAGWVAELIARPIWRGNARYFGPILFIAGLVFSTLFIAVPGIFMVIGD